MSRKKHVFSTIGELCHTWAHSWRSLGNGRTGSGSVYFQQETIFSYGAHYPIARFTEDASGETVVLLNSDSYSVSTGNHCREVASAVSHFTAFSVLDPCAQTPEQHKANWTELRGNLNEARNTLAAARSPNGYELEHCDTQAKKANDYAKAFNVQGLESHQNPLVAFTDRERSAWREKINLATVELEIRRIAAAEKNCHS